MKIFYNNQEYEINAFITEYLKEKKPTTDFIDKIIAEKELKKFIENNNNKTLQFNTLKNPAAISGIANATVVKDNSDSANLFSQQFLSLFKKLDEYKAPEQQGQQQGQPQVNQLGQQQVNQQEQQQINQQPQPQPQVAFNGNVEGLEYKFSVSQPLFNKINTRDFDIRGQDKKGAFKNSVNGIFDAMLNDKKASLQEYNKFEEVHKLRDPFFALSDEDNEHKIKINLPLIKAVADSNDKELANNIKGVFDTFFKQYFVKNGETIAERLGEEQGVSPNVGFDSNEDSDFFDLFKIKYQEPVIVPVIQGNNFGSQYQLQPFANFGGDEQEIIKQEEIEPEKIIEQERARIRELINGFNFDNVDEFKLPTSPFIIKKFANGIIEIINDNNHIQINAKNGASSLTQELYDKIKSEDVDNLLKDENFQNSLKEAIGESEKYLLSFKNREKPCYSYRQEKANNLDSYDININFGIATADKFSSEEAFKKFVAENAINQYFLVKIADNKYVKFDIVVGSDNKLVPVLSRNKNEFLGDVNDIMIYKANGVESYVEDGLEMYSNEDFKQAFPSAGNITISCKSSYRQGSENVDLFDFKGKTLGDVIDGGFNNYIWNGIANGFSNLFQSESIENVAKEMEYSSDAKKEEYKIAQIQKINDKLKKFLDESTNGFDENFKSYVELKTIENQQDQMLQNSAINENLVQIAASLIEKYNLAKQSISEKSLKQPDNQFKPRVVVPQNNQQQLNLL